jgi:hypothetical protein
MGLGYLLVTVKNTLEDFLKSEWANVVRNHEEVCLKTI